MDDERLERRITIKKIFNHENGPTVRSVNVCRIGAFEIGFMQYNPSKLGSWTSLKYFAA